MDIGMNREEMHLAGFDIATEADIVLRALRVGDADDVPLDDQTFIEIGGDVSPKSRRSASRCVRMPACKGSFP